MRVSLQGIESVPTYEVGGPKGLLSIGTTNPSVIEGDADLTAVYVLAP
jgi:hypothetical protein